jgi:hypothetical protein
MFSRLLPLATASHLRLVILNRRGYSGSTPYSDEEISAINPAEHDEASGGSSRTDRRQSGQFSTFMQQRGAEMARFLSWFIDNERIPPRSDDEGVISGGISLLGWSLGNTTTLSLLGFANTLDPGLMKKLEGYLRKIVIYGALIFLLCLDRNLVGILVDAPHHALGYRTPDNAYNPLFDPKIPAAQRQTRFRSWVTSYWVHSPATLDRDPSLRDPLIGLEQHTPNPLKQTTQTNISAADVEAGFETISITHGDPIALLPQARPVHEDVRLRAIFGDLNGTSVPVSLPNVGISYIWCTQSVWETVLAARLLKEEIASPPGYHYTVRPVEFFALEGNHYVRPRCGVSVQ